MHRLGAALVLTFLFAGAAHAQEEAPPSLEELQRRLDAQQAELDRQRELLRGLRDDGGAAAPPEAPPAPGPSDPGRLAELERELEELRAEVRMRRGADDEGSPGGGRDALPSDERLHETQWTERVRVGTFFIESRDEDYRLELKARLHVDGRFTDRGVDDFNDHVEVRRARFEFMGHLFGKDRLTYKFGLEFGRTSDADLRDAWVNLRLVDALQLRAGQMLLPFSTERLTSSNYMIHPERPIIIGSIVGQRDVGAMLHGELVEGLLFWYVGGFNGAGENVRADVDDDFDLAARLELTPWDDHLLLAASYMYTPTDRSASNHGPSDVRTVGNEFTRFLDYSGSNRHLGHRERGALEARLRVGPLELKGELVFDYHREVRSSRGVEANLLTLSWFVDAAWLLLGTRKGDKVEPEACLFDPETDALGPGAFDVALRYEDYDAERRVITDGFATGTDRVRAITGTLHWYPWSRSRLSASYTGSMYGDEVLDARGRETHGDHAFIVRWTLYF